MSARDREPAGARDERVLVENDWYDGPRSGLADVDGVPHYFQAVHSYWHVDDPDDEEYFVWPASADALGMERELWAMFVYWLARFHAGTASADTHPAYGGDTRHDELEALLSPHREVPPDARRLAARWKGLGRGAGARYGADGPSYAVRWLDLPDVR